MMTLKIRMNRIKATWRNVCFEKIDDHLVHTIPNHHPTKMDVLPKTFVQIILATKSDMGGGLMPPSLTVRFLKMVHVFYNLNWAMAKARLEMGDTCYRHR